MEGARRVERNRAALSAGRLRFAEIASNRCGGWRTAAANSVNLTFDRGTLLWDGAQVPECSASGLLFDARVGKARAPAFRHREVVAALHAAGHRVVDGVVAAGPAPGSWQAVALRNYQEDALSAWTAGGQRGIVVLPTGAGKTRVALAAMARCGVRTLVLVPTRVLLEQWETAIADCYSGEVGVLGDGQKRLTPITVATFESGVRKMAEIGNHFELLVVDEVHHFGSGARDETLWMAVAAARLGLTATPVQSLELERLMGPVVCEVGLADLVGTHLAPFSHVVLHAELDAEERARYDADANCFFAELAGFREIAAGGSWHDFVRYAAKSETGRAALQAWTRMKRIVAWTSGKRRLLAELLERHTGNRVLVFTADTESAYAITREHLILPITSDIGREERVATLEHFRSGRVRVLVSARVLNEGLDVPEADIGIIVGGTLGHRELRQRVGRVLRPAPGKHAHVYELVAHATLEERQSRKKHAALRS